MYDKKLADKEYRFKHKKEEVKYMKFGKEIVLSIAPYKTVRLTITEADSYEDCDKEIMKEINQFPEIKKLNAEEIKKVLRE